MSLPSKLFLVHMRFLISGSLLVWIRSESIHHNLRSPFATPLDSTVFPTTQEYEKENYVKRLSAAPSWSIPSMRRASETFVFWGVNVRDVLRSGGYASVNA